MVARDVCVTPFREGAEDGDRRVLLPCRAGVRDGCGSLCRGGGVVVAVVFRTWVSSSWVSSSSPSSAMSSSYLLVLLCRPLCWSCTRTRRAEFARSCENQTLTIFSTFLKTSRSCEEREV